MLLDQYEWKRLANFEEDLRADSLARRANWPQWATELAADTTCSRTLLQRIQDYGRTVLGTTLVYLGTPFDKRRGEPIVPRQTRSTEEGGHYFHEPKRTMFVDDFEAAILRAVINKNTIWGARQARLWSGWFTAHNRLWLMTHRDMLSPPPSGTHFVAVCDIAKVDPENISRPDVGPEVFCYEDVEPTMFVPVRSSDLSPYTILINEGGVDRPAAAKIYQAARNNLAEARQQYDLVPLNTDQAWPIPLCK